MNAIDSLKDVRILFVDDEETLGWSIQRELSKHGAEVNVAHTIRQATTLFAQTLPDLVVTDLKLPDGNGMDLLKTWRTEYPQMPIILITAHGAIDSAVSALRMGAFDYLQKPFGLSDLLAAVQRAAEIAHLRQKLHHIEAFAKPREPLQIVGDSQATVQLRYKLNRVAKSRADTVLIYGETGSGKELAARAIHEWSPSIDMPFVEINCASIPENLLESELFGYEKGAFTDARARKLGLFEIAKDGTIFLDEIGEMPLKLQAKLLRALEYRKFKRLGGVKDVDFRARVVAATNRNLQERIRAGEFRLDLYYRLNAISVSIPPLRDRVSDIPALTDFLLRKICEDQRVEQPKITKEARDTLAQHSWPGNVRELRNVLLQSVIMHGSPEITPEHLTIETFALESNTQTQELKPTEKVGATRINSESNIGYVLPAEGVSLESFEKNLLQQALERSHQNQSHAAQLLKISRHTLRYRMEKFGLLMK